METVTVTPPLSHLTVRQRQMQAELEKRVREWKVRVRELKNRLQESQVRNWWEKYREYNLQRERERERKQHDNKPISSDREWCKMRSGGIRVIYAPNSNSNVSLQHQYGWLYGADPCPKATFYPSLQLPQLSLEKNKYNTLFFSMMYYINQGSLLSTSSFNVFWESIGILQLLGTKVNPNESRCMTDCSENTEQ